jgi:tetratricopeptide (TPR) repeat protein
MRASLLSVVALVVLVGGAAHASPHGKLKANREPADPEAVEHLKHGNRALAPGVEDYETAIREYKAGAIQDPVPLFWLDLGLAYRKANRYPEAIDAYREFLKRSADDADPDGYRDQVNKLIPQLEAARNAPPSHPEPSATTTPSPANGSQTPPSGSTSGATGAAMSSAGSPSTASTTTIEAHASPSHPHDPVGWGLTAAGAVAAGVGIGFLWSADSLDGDANQTPNANDRDQLHNRASSRRTIGAITAGAGAALLVTGVVKLLLFPPSPSRSSLTIAPGPGDVGLGFAVQF